METNVGGKKNYLRHFICFAFKNNFSTEALIFLLFKYKAPPHPPRKRSFSLQKPYDR